MNDRDQFLKDITPLWQGMLADDDDVLEKAHKLCEKEIMSRVKFANEDAAEGRCGEIFMLCLVKTYNDGVEAFVDTFDDEVNKITNTTDAIDDGNLKRIWTEGIFKGQKP